MNVETKKRLRDVLDATAAIQEFTGAKNFLDYDRNLLLRSAVERQFEIIGEALAKLEDCDQLTASQIPDLRRIVGLRNRIIHGYDSVDNEIVWDIVKNKLPTLREQVQKVQDSL